MWVCWSGILQPHVWRWQWRMWWGWSMRASPNVLRYTRFALLKCCSVHRYVGYGRILLATHTHTHTHTHTPIYLFTYFKAFSVQIWPIHFCSTKWPRKERAQILLILSVITALVEVATFLQVWGSFKPKSFFSIRRPNFFGLIMQTKWRAKDWQDHISCLFTWYQTSHCITCKVQICLHVCMRRHLACWWARYSISVTFQSIGCCCVVVFAKNYITTFVFRIVDLTIHTLVIGLGKCL